MIFNDNRGIILLIFIKTYVVCAHQICTLSLLLNAETQFEPHHEKNQHSGFRPGPTQTRLYSYRRWLEA